MKTKITLHGILGQALKKEWNLCVKSVSEALNAIEILSKRKLYKTLLENDKTGTMYRVLVNGEDFISEKPLDLKNPESFVNCELIMQKELKTIDIVPVFAGADANWATIILGITLVVVGILITVGTLGGGTPLGVGLIIAGVGLIAAGVINLLTSPPKFEDFREIAGNRRLSYLFNGPENTTGEGGPVPIGYGEGIFGSQVIAASYIVEQIDGTDTLTT